MHLESWELIKNPYQLLQHWLILMHLLQTLLIGCSQSFSSHLLFSPPSSALSEFSPSFVTQDRLRSISQTPLRQRQNPCFPGSRRESVTTHAGPCGSVLIPRELFRPSERNEAVAQIWTWPGCCEQTARRSQLSSGPWKTNNLSHLVKTWAKPPLIFLSG